MEEAEAEERITPEEVRERAAQEEEEPEIMDPERLQGQRTPEAAEEPEAATRMPRALTADPVLSLSAIRTACLMRAPR